MLRGQTRWVDYIPGLEDELSLGFWGMNYLLISASIMSVFWVGEGFVSFIFKLLSRSCVCRGSGWCVWLLKVQAIKGKFDPDLAVNDSTSQNLVFHEKHGDGPVILEVVVRVKWNSEWRTVEVCGGDFRGWLRLTFCASTFQMFGCVRAWINSK